MRVSKASCRGERWWHETSPHSRPPMTMDTDMEAQVSMLRMYSRCTGDTLRRKAWDRSSVAAEAPPSVDNKGTGA